MNFDSKLIRKLMRRAQFASLVAADPRRGAALYRLIAKPDTVDSLSLANLSNSETLYRLKSSSLISTGNVRVPLKVAENLYLNGQIDEALALVRRTPGREAQLLDGWLSLHIGELERATDIFTAASDRQSTKPEACKNLALCHYLRGDESSAVDTALIGAAIYPRAMALMTLFSRIVRDKEDIHRYLSEKMRIARNGFTASSAAQFIRACGRAGARDEGELTARGAVVNFCQQHRPRGSSAGRQETGLRKGAYSASKGDLVLQHVADVVDARNVRLFLVGGTLLGLVRDKALLSWDKDVDFGCFVEDASLQDLWEMFSSSPYFIPMGTVGDRLIKLRHFTGVAVDIFINFQGENERWHGGQFVYWRDRPFEPEAVTIQGRKLFVPTNAEEYLEGHYGPRWRDPDPHFDVFWEAPNAFSPNKEHRYLNTIAKGLQFLAAGSVDMMKIRLERARKSDAEDVVAGYQYVLELIRTFSTHVRSDPVAL